VGLPFLGQRPTFGFIVHPRGREDMIRAKCLSVLRATSTSEEDFVERVCSCPPTIVGEISFGFTPYRGELVAISRFPHDVGTLRGREEILQAAKMMADRGARVVGLGGLTSPATAGGEWLAGQLAGRVTVTNGNAYTAAVLRRNVLDAGAALDLPRPLRVAIVGAAGSVGSVVSQLLAKSGVDLILIGRTTSKVRHVLGRAAPDAMFSESLSDAALADVVLSVTSDPSAFLTQDHIRPGAIVIDAAEPSNIPESATEEWRPHAIVMRGGRVRIPGYHCSYEIGFEDPSETFACLAETYLFAREGISEHSVGAPTPELAERLERAAARHGVRPIFALPEAVATVGSAAIATGPAAAAAE
jgi:predicted amino acid dehydrogenase